MLKVLKTVKRGGSLQPFFYSNDISTIDTINIIIFKLIRHIIV